MDAPKTKIIRLSPNTYVHILNRNTNVTRLEIGPKTLICKEHERVVFGPEKMLIILPQHYCVVQNPVLRSAEKSQKKEQDLESFVASMNEQQNEVEFDDNGWKE